jgi:hypothetical protein
MMSNIGQLYEQLFMKFRASVDIDPGVFHAINRGIIIGSLVLSFFILFPGEPFEFRTTDKSCIAPNRTIHRQDQITCVKNQKHTSIDNVVVEDIESSDASWSIPVLANIAFYILLFVGGLYIFSHVYGISLIQVIKFHFPREAAVFGF